MACALTGYSTKSIELGTAVVPTYPRHPTAMAQQSDGTLLVGVVADLRSRDVAAGGQITRPIFAFPGGRRFHFTDPDGYELGIGRLAPTPIEIPDLPRVDVILISHAHFDHLDRPSLRRRWVETRQSECVA